MKKKFSLVILIVLMIASLFISCDNGITESDPYAKVLFVDADNITRGLSSSSPEFDATQLFWTYEAQKMDNSGLKTGETTQPVAVKDNAAGLDEPVGPFSLGVWKFTLHAHSSAGGPEVYTGTVSNIVIKSGSTNKVSVKVHALQEGNGTVKIADDITLTDAKGNVIDQYDEVITFARAEAPTEPVVLEHVGKTYSVPAGSWKVTIEYLCPENHDIAYGRNSIYVTVFANQTVVINGTLEEITGSADFETTEDGGLKVAETKPVEFTAVEQPEDVFNGRNVLTIEAATSPALVEKPESGAAVEKKTTVTIPETAIPEASGSATLNVTSYAAPAAAKKFTVEAAKPDQATNVVSALDLDLAVAESAVTNFEEPIRVVTYIPTGLTKVDVIYNGGGEQPTDVKYDPETGKLSFMTSHFSAYCVVSDSEALNLRSNKSFDTLAEAFADPDIKSGDEIMLLKDVANTDYTKANVKSFNLPAGVILNGNGHSISGNCKVNINVAGGTIRDVNFEYIHNDEKKHNSNYKFKEPKTGDLTAVYAPALTGKAVIENCVFNTFDWEGVQLTPAAGAEIYITGNIFKYDKNQEMMREPIRNIHIESDYNVDFKAVVTGNYLFDNDVLYYTGLEVYFPTDLSKVYVSNNYIDSPVGVYIAINGGELRPTLALPFSEGPNGEPAYHAACYTYDKYNNVLFYDTLKGAIDNIVAGKNIVLLEDMDIEGPLGIDENRIVLNGHKIIRKWDGTSVDKTWYKEQDTEFTISRPEQLAGLAALVNGTPSVDFSGKTIRLDSDIYLNNKEWTPIGTATRKGAGLTAESTPFKGKFHGNNHKITGLYIHDSKWTGDTAQGLFGAICGKEALVDGLDVTGDVVTGSEGASMIVGFSLEGATVSNCISRGKIEAVSAGGIVSRMIKIGKIENCTNYAAIKGTKNNGGIVSAAYYDQDISGETAWAERDVFLIDNCKNYGTVYSDVAAGGIAGFTATATISNSENHGKVTGNGTSAGGIVGEIRNGGDVISCTNYSEVKNLSKDYGTGGIVGWTRFNDGAGNKKYFSTIKNCVNKGYVHSDIVDGSAGVGGIGGVSYWAVTYENCTNVGNVTNDHLFTGGICGNIQNPPEVYQAGRNVITFKNCKVADTAVINSNGKATGRFVGHVNHISENDQKEEVGRIELVVEGCTPMPQISLDTVTGW